MARGARRAVLLVGLALAPGLLAGGPAVAAQVPDPAAVDAALVAIAREAQVLLELGVLTGATEPLGTALAPLGPAPPEPGTALPALDAAAAQAWQPVRDVVGRPSRDADQAGSPLPEGDIGSAQAGQPISLTADVYLRALDHLVLFDGAPPESPQPPDPGAIAAALTAALDAVPPTSGPGTTSPATTAPATTGAPDPAEGNNGAEGEGDDGEDDGGDLAAAGLVAVLVAGALVVAVLVTRRRPIPPPSAKLDALLEVSRRLTAAAASGEVDRAIVRDAMGLVPAQGAVLVRREGDRLVLGHESHQGLVVADALGGGLVERVAETGQPLLQVSASEPSIRQLPVALAAVPLVVGGAVTAVLLLVRDPDRPFDRAEADVLTSLAPIAAAAIQSAGQAQAAIEESLIDPLTGVGNRRRLDADLAAAGDAPIALVIADIDHFKAVNDTHGHPTGDAVLRNVAAALRRSVRPADRVYRFGGEEFCVLLLDTGTDVAAEVAAEVAERARVGVAAVVTPAGGSDGAAVRVTASFGVAAGTAADGPAVVQAADSALYDAKATGRDRVVISGP